MSVELILFILTLIFVGVGSRVVIKLTTPKWILTPLEFALAVRDSAQRSGTSHYSIEQILKMTNSTPEEYHEAMVRYYDRGARF